MSPHGCLVRWLHPGPSGSALRIRAHRRNPRSAFETRIGSAPPVSASLAHGAAECLAGFLRPSPGPAHHFPARDSLPEAPCADCSFSSTAGVGEQGPSAAQPTTRRCRDHGSRPSSMRRCAKRSGSMARRSSMSCRNAASPASVKKARGPLSVLRSSSRQRSSMVCTAGGIFG